MSQHLSVSCLVQAQVINLVGTDNGEEGVPSCKDRVFASHPAQLSRRYLHHWKCCSRLARPPGAVGTSSRETQPHRAKGRKGGWGGGNRPET